VDSATNNRGPTGKGAELARAVAAAKVTVPGCFARGWLLVAFACFCGWAAPAAAQTPPSFAAPAAYNAQPGTVPVGVATGVFNNTGGYLDFAVLEQVQNPIDTTYQVEIFHGKSDGTFCTYCSNSGPNTDVIPLGSGVAGNAIAVGQFRTGYLDIVVATGPVLGSGLAPPLGIAYLENDGSGNFSLTATYSSPSALDGFVSLAVGQFDGTGNYDIAAVSPAVSGTISLTVFFGDGTGSFLKSSTSSVSSGYVQCSAILQGSFQGLTNAADLALLCNTPYEEAVLVYLNNGSGTFGLYQTLGAGQRVVGVSTGVAVGTLNSLPAIFISPPAGSFTSYQYQNLSTGFTSVPMIPVGSAPRGSLALLPQTGLEVAFATSGSGVSVSTFSGYTQMPPGAPITGTWYSTESLGPPGVLATGVSQLTQGMTYVVVDAGVHTGSYANYETYVDERSVSVFLVTLNADGTVATANAVPVYSGTALFTTGDFTADGKMDLAVAEGGVDVNGNTTLSIYLADSQSGALVGTSSPSGSATVNIGAYNSVGAIVAGRFRPAQEINTRPYYDLAVFSSGQIFILTSIGNGTFSSAVPLLSTPLSGSAGVLTAVDVNGDGLDDIVLTLPEANCNGSGSVSQGAVYVLISNGDGTFQAPVFVPPPVVNPVSVTAAKFFGTSQNDLVFADGGEVCSGTNTATTSLTAVGILQNNVPQGAAMVNSSEFTSAAILTQGSDLGVPNVTAVASYLDGNGSPDLVVSSTAGIQVLLNQGGGTFGATMQGTVPLYAGDQPYLSFCTAGNRYVGCVAYDSQLATGSFFATGENDVAASVGGVVYIFQNLGNTGILQSPTQGFVAGPNSTVLSAAIFNPYGLNNLLVGTSQGTAYLVNNGQGTATGPPQPPAILEAFGTTSMPEVDVTTLTFTIINPNTSTALTEVGFTDNFLPGLVVANPSSFSACGGTVTATAVSVSLSGAKLLAGTYCTVTVNVTGTGPGTMPNSVTVTNPVTVSALESGSATYTATASITLFTPYPPNVTKSFGAASIALGGMTTLYFTISNLNYNTSLTGINFKDDLSKVGMVVATPNNLYFDPKCGDKSMTTATAGSSLVSLMTGSLLPGTYCQFNVDVIGTQPGPWINNLAVYAYESGSQVGNSSAPITVVGTAPPPPQISTVTPNIGAQGQQGLQVTITGANFVAGSTAVTIGANVSAGITVSLGTVTSTSITATLNIPQTTPAANYDVVVTVTGAPPPATLTGGFTVAVTIPTVPEMITVNDQVTVTPLVINFAPPAAFFSASMLGFNGTSGAQTLTVSNVGGTALAFSGPLAVSGPFTIIPILCYDGTTTFPMMLPSGGACTLTINYTASGMPMNDSGAIVFTDNAALSSPASMPASGGYTQTIYLSGTLPTVVGQPPSGTVTVPMVSETITVNDRVGLSATTLSSSNANAPENTLITLTATVQAAASGNPTPTGTVTFFDGQTPLTGTSTIPNPALVNGTASYATSSLAVGVHPLTAVYSGDMNFPGSSSQVLVETIAMQGQGGFSLLATPPSLTIQQGQSGTTTITVTSTGYTGTLTLSCPTLPSYAECLFTPSPFITLSGSGSSGQRTLTLYTTGLNGVGSVGGPPAGWEDSQHMRPGRVPPVLPAAVLLLIGMLALAARQKNEKKLIARLALIVLLAGLGMLTACYHYGTPILPGAVFTPIGQSKVVVSVSGNGTTQTLTLPVTITPGQ